LNNAWVPNQKLLGTYIADIMDKPLAFKQATPFS
jgi:hypothetical protein